MTPSENPGILRLETQGLRLWRAGQEAVSLDDATGDLGKNCAFAVPADRARLTHITGRSDEHRHLKQSLPFMLEDAVIDRWRALFSGAGITGRHERLVAAAGRWL